MKLAIDASSAHLGGAATYVRDALRPTLDALGTVVRRPVILWSGGVAPALDADDGWLDVRVPAGAAAGGLPRLAFDHLVLPRATAREGVDVLFSTANVAPLLLGSRRVLLVRNAAPFSRQYLRRMPAARIRMRLRMHRWLIRRSLSRAHVVLFPSAAMRDLALAGSVKTGGRLVVAPYGTRHDRFFPAPRGATRPPGPIRVLNVSYYSDQKNLGTWLGAAEILNRRATGRFAFDCTAGFDVEWLARAPQFPRFCAERDRFFALRRRGVARDLGWVAHDGLPEIYRASDVFVFASYVESFGHPLLEAMACGLPVVAADTPIHREICGDAAEYFDTFSAASLAQTLDRLVDVRDWRRLYQEKSVERARAFTWDAHAARVADSLVHAWRGGTG